MKIIFIQIIRLKHSNIEYCPTILPTCFSSHSIENEQDQIEALLQHRDLTDHSDWVPMKEKIDEEKQSN